MPSKRTRSRLSENHNIIKIWPTELELWLLKTCYVYRIDSGVHDAHVHTYSNIKDVRVVSSVSMELLQRGGDVYTSQKMAVRVRRQSTDIGSFTPIW